MATKKATSATAIVEPELEGKPIPVDPIQELKEQNDILKHQLEDMRNAFSGVQKQKADLETELHRVKTAASTQVQFCKDTVAQAYKTLHYMKDLEEI